MAASIKFDSTEIRDTTHIPRYVKHESTADRDVVSLPLAREDGEILILTRYGKKRIVLAGIITGANQAALEAAIDTFKELFSREEKNLDVDWNGGTMRFVATCVKHDFDRDYFHLNFCPWTAEFTVLSGEGKDTTTTKAQDQHSLSISYPANSVTDTAAVTGSKAPRPTLKIESASWGTAIKGIEYKNTDTGERIVVTRNYNWGNNAYVQIDCSGKIITDNAGGTVVANGKFFGVFPRFKVGTNNIKISCGGIVNQSSSDTDINTLSTSWNLNSTLAYVAQKFSVPYLDDTFRGVTVALSKFGSPGAALTWRIETDNAGKPSGTLADANATGVFYAASVGTSKAYLTSYSDNLWAALSDNTDYWLVLKSLGVDGSNYYIIWNSNVADYPRGKVATSADGGTNWTQQPGYNLAFRILYGGSPDNVTIKHTFEYTKTYL